MASFDQKGKNCFQVKSIEQKTFFRKIYNIVENLEKKCL